MLLYAVVLAVCGVVVSSEQESCLRSLDGSDEGDDCLFRHDLTEMLKQQILNKLGMKEPPKVTSKPELPEELMHKYIQDDFDVDDSYEALADAGSPYVIPKEVSIFPDNDSSPVCQGEAHLSRCFVFQLPGYIIPEAIENVIFYLYVKKSSRHWTLTVSEVISDVPDYIKKNYLETLDSSNSSYWVKTDVSMLAKTWYHRHEPTFIVEVSCVECGNNLSSVVALEKKPLVLVISDPYRYHASRAGGLTRTKRSTKCEDGTNHCCVEPFRVSFKEMGWEDWVVNPKTFEANYCRGSCANELDTDSANYRMIKRFIKDKGENVTELCCVPSHMKDLSLSYYGSDNLMTRSLMPKMIVESCDCL